MKKIAFVIESLNLGGAETSLITLLNSLDFDEYEVDLILFSTENFFINYVPVQVAIKFIELPSLSLFDRLRFKLFRTFNLKNLHNAQILWPIISRKLNVNSAKYDYIHAYNQGFATYYVGIFMTAIVKNAWINIDYQSAGYDINFDIPFYSSFKRIITISDAVDIGFRQELDGINRSVETEIIKLFTDEKLLKKRSQEYKPNELVDNTISIVTVCRLTEQKGLHLAIQSCRKLIDLGYKLNWYVVGEGRLRVDLEKEISKLGLKGHFHLLGIRENPFPYMAACDIYVQTSLFEGWGLTLIEAVLLKKRVVTTNFPTAYNIVDDGYTGLIAEMSASDLTNKIFSILDNVDVQHKLDNGLENRANVDKAESMAIFNRLHIQN